MLTWLKVNPNIYENPIQETPNRLALARSQNIRIKTDVEWEQIHSIGLTTRPYGTINSLPPKNISHWYPKKKKTNRIEQVKGRNIK